MQPARAGLRAECWPGQGSSVVIFFLLLGIKLIYVLFYVEKVVQIQK